MRCGGVGEQVWKLGWKPLLGVAVLLVVMDPSSLTGWDEWVESGHGFQEGTVLH